MVVREKPASSQPSYGDQSAFVSITLPAAPRGVTFIVLLGWMIAKSASAPMAIAPLRGANPMIRAGSVLNLRHISSRVIRPPSTPLV